MRTLGTIMGGPNVVAPGQSSEVILDLPAGQYAVVSAVLGKDGKRDFQRGMVSTFAVTWSATTGQATTPTSTAQITMQSFSYSEIPTNVAAGAVTWQVTNAGTEPYEFYVVKLAPGKTAHDVIAFYAHPSGPPPFASIGGMSSISPGLTGWVKFDLATGNYLAFTQVFDKATGKSQFLLGCSPRSPCTSGVDRRSARSHDTKSGETIRRHDCSLSPWTDAIRNGPTTYENPQETNK